MKKLDIVYVLKDDVEPDELRYSLRSVCKNFTFNRIVFYCGKPEGIEPDIYIPFVQTGDTKWEKARSTFKAFLSNDELTDDVYLFNDDFFVMKKYKQDVPISNGTIKRQIERIKARSGHASRYVRRLQALEQGLLNNGLDTISYETHTPFLINRSKGMEVLRKFDYRFTFRTTYGNYYEIGGILQHDDKIVDHNEVPNKSSALLSTTEISFAKGKVGEYIRKSFPEPCKYEVMK